MVEKFSLTELFFSVFKMTPMFFIIVVMRSKSNLKRSPLSRLLSHAPLTNMWLLTTQDSSYYSGNNFFLLPIIIYLASFKNSTELTISRERVVFGHSKSFLCDVMTGNLI